MRVAAIDCGTNSIRLLIAEVYEENGARRLRDIVRLMRIVRLGEGIDATGEFAPAALERTFDAAREYAALIAEHNVPTEAIRFVATSASRDARNKQVFIDGIREILGIELEVISGDEEASLSFAGALLAVGADERETLVFDLGGGSTEFVLGTVAGVQVSKSVNIGCVRLTERLMHHAPALESEIDAVRAEADERIAEAAAIVPLERAQRLVAVAGTATTVAAAALGLDSYDSAAINAQYFTVEQVQETASWLASLSTEERSALGYMHPGRVDVIGTGATIYARIVERVSELTGGAVEGVTVSEHDILDGIALSITARLS